MTTSRFEFQAEVKQLLDLMVHSLYSDKDIFLRELVSNASDALDKLRFEQLTRPELRAPEELHIRLEFDAEKRTLSITDNGIGMSREEVVKNIGTIARSGTKEYLAQLRAESAQTQGEGRAPGPELIGQFGVGFYSSFMVAEKVVLLTRKAGEESATVWESTGDGTYAVGDAVREQAGTTITLELKPADPEHGLHDYTQAAKLKEIVKRYSDFVAYPIKLKHWRSKEGAAGAKVLEEETLNSMKAIWMRPKAEVEEADYREFYRHISHDWSEPLLHIPLKIEGTFEAYALLFVPSRAPFDLFSPEMKRGVQLYVKRVFVMDECKDLAPSYLRFVKGVVDAHDLSLNVSREILQKDRQIQAIKKQLTKKVLGSLEELKKDSREKYQGFWEQFGQVLKEGLVPYDVKEKDKLLELLLVHSTAGEQQTSLEDYLGRMPPGQEAIYYLAAPTLEAARRSPLLESFKAKGYEVLLFTDPIDELWLDRGQTFREKGLVSVGKGELKLGTEEEQKQAAEARESTEQEFKDLLSCIRAHVQDEVKEVRLSQRLTSSPVCLVVDADDMSPQLGKILERMGQKVPLEKPILEVNAGHPLLGKMQALFAADRADPRLELFSRLLLDQARLLESGQLADPGRFAERLTELMVRAG